MESDPEECLYYQNNEMLHNLMIEIVQLSVSRVFLFKEQTAMDKAFHPEKINFYRKLILPLRNQSQNRSHL